ncbi:MAG: hypothetical protein U5K70_04070 [Halodesulfurarchaeum sp.]|nr:hypothetical protein [Halodesulfurarchaeum sp.]
MTPWLPSRGVSIVLLGLLALVLVSMSGFGPAFENVIYTGYGLAIPFMFGLFVLAGIYFGTKHLLFS